MNEITGAAMLLAAGALYLRYRPVSREPRLLCAMTALMGVMSLTVGEGSWKVQAVQAALSFVVALCCALSLRRGRARREGKAQERVPQVQSGDPREKTCA